MGTSFCKRLHPGAGHIEHEPGTAGEALLAINPFPPGGLPRSIPVESNVPMAPGACMPRKATLLVGKDGVGSCSKVACGAAAPNWLEAKEGRVPTGGSWPLPAVSSQFGGLTTAGAIGDIALAPNRPAPTSPFAAGAGVPLPSSGKAAPGQGLPFNPGVIVKARGVLFGMPFPSNDGPRAPHAGRVGMFIALTTGRLPRPMPRASMLCKVVGPVCKVVGPVKLAIPVAGVKFCSCS